MGLYHVELKSKGSPENTTLTLVETQQFPDIEKFDSMDEISCLKSTTYKGRRKICINVQTGSDQVNIVVYRYRNHTYLKDTEMELKLTEYKKILAKRVSSCATSTFFTSGALYWMKQLFIIKTNSVMKGCSLSN